jgi:Na+/H+ antiporter NhaC
MRKLVLAGLAALIPIGAFAEPAIKVEADGAVLAGAPLHLKVIAEEVPEGVSREAEVLVGGRSVHVFQLASGEQNLRIETPETSHGTQQVVVRTGWAEGTATVRGIAGWLSVIPPLFAIILALISKDVLISLFLGVFSGALILVDWNPIRAFARSVDSIVAPAIADLDHAKILVFTMLLGGMVGVISRSGGTLGIVERIRRFATTSRRGQISARLMAVLIFFDDYANTLIVGSTMRPITDKLRISREKLAYVVDSTAAPLASIAPISTWIGFEVGLIAASFTELSIPYNPYSAFVGSIAYRFYPIFALVLGFAIAFSCRDFGPMLKAEIRARDTGKVVADGDVPLADYSSSALAPPPGIPHRAMNALVPILTVIGVTIGGLYVSGSAGLSRADHPSVFKWIQEVFSNANSLDVLLWASLAAATVALLLPIVQRILTIRQAMEGLVEGFKSMLLACAVLVLAWAIGVVTGQLHTADYVVGLTSGVLSPHWLPVLVFVISAGISFATGTSWGTMAILMPLAIPIAHRLSLAAGHEVTGEPYYIFMLGTISSVLAGSVWGDHCSPISDTTILSSMSSGCDHIAHVRTQLPYAFTIGIVGMIVGDIPTAYGMSPWISILVGSAIIIGGLYLFGKRVDWKSRPDAAAAG